MTGKLTTHALDTLAGKGAARLRGTLLRLAPTPAKHGDFVLDDTGRGVLLEALEAGIYEITFKVAEYHRAAGVELETPAFLPAITIRFGVAAPDEHYHVPLLFTPYSYSTYRGS